MAWAQARGVIGDLGGVRVSVMMICPLWRGGAYRPCNSFGLRGFRDGITGDCERVRPLLRALPLFVEGDRAQDNAIPSVSLRFTTSTQRAAQASASRPGAADADRRAAPGQVWCAAGPADTYFDRCGGSVPASRPCARPHSRNLDGGRRGGQAPAAGRRNQAARNRRGSRGFAAPAADHSGFVPARCAPDTLPAASAARVSSAAASAIAVASAVE